MRSQLTDEQIDQMMRTLIDGSALDERSVDEIADSPKLWWAIQKDIRNSPENSRQPWPPIAKWMRFAVASVPVAAAVLFGYFAFMPAVDKSAAEGVGSLMAVVADNTPDRRRDEAPAFVSPQRPVKMRVKEPKPSVSAKRTVQKDVARPQLANETAPEVRSDFIALTYARRPESGHIVRVKVPSSMMVTLGLVATVDRPSALVDAEVLVGDDGTSHSIRFIR